MDPFICTTPGCRSNLMGLDPDKRCPECGQFQIRPAAYRFSIDLACHGCGRLFEKPWDSCPRCGASPTWAQCVEFRRLGWAGAPVMMNGKMGEKAKEEVRPLNAPDRVPQNTPVQVITTAWARIRRMLPL